MTQDPIGLEAGLNFYQYVDGNPVGWVDPLGLDGLPGFNKNPYEITPEIVTHSNLGEWTEAVAMKPKDRTIFPNGRLSKGGHGQSAILELERRGISYNIEHVYSNGVRVGNIPEHATKAKRSGSNQSWFPESWNDADIKSAGKYVLQSSSSSKEELVSGGTMVSGYYNNVFIRVVIDPKGKGSIFPDSKIQ